jgi:hypothetical protein
LNYNGKKAAPRLVKSSTPQLDSAWLGERRAKPASTMTDNGKQAVNSEIRRCVFNDGVSYPKLARPEVD